MTCDRARKGLSDGRVGPATEAHLAACADCAAWAEALRRVRLAAPALVPAAPVGLTERLLGGLAEVEPGFAAGQAPQPEPAPSGRVVVPPFWGTALRKATAGLVAAALVAAALLVTSRRPGQPETVLVSAVEVLADPATRYDVTVEGRAEARFAPPELPPPPGEDPAFPLPPMPEPPPAPRAVPAPPMPDIGPGLEGMEQFQRDLETWREGLGDAFGDYQRELQAWMRRLRERMDAYGRALQEAMRRHAEDWQAYHARVWAELEPLAAEIEAGERERYGQDRPWTPTHVEVHYRGQGQGRGQERHADVDYTVRTPVEVRRRDRVDGRRSPSHLADVSLDEALALLREQAARAERIEERDGRRAYRLRGDAGVELEASVDADGSLRELVVVEQRTEGVVERSARTTYRFDTYARTKA